MDVRLMGSTRLPPAAKESRRLLKYFSSLPSWPPPGKRETGKAQQKPPQSCSRSASASI
jgi:hypothetical protein